MRDERKLILFFCAVAAVRVLIFSAAFPFFNNVDEQAHIDLVMKYARGQVPRELGHYSAESANYISLYSTPEYFTAPQQFSGNDFPPPNWTLPIEQRDDVVNRTSAWWLANENHESGEPPLYYTIAGLWLILGRVCGITGAWSLYWIRFFNMFVAALLVWVGFVAARLVFPDRRFICLSVPFLLAIWPQTTFYSITSDSLSPLCFGIAFIGLVRLLRAEAPNLPLAIGTGLALAATCLVKTTNIVLLLVAALAIIFQIRNLSQTRAVRPHLASVAALIGSAVIPIALWFAWNLHTFGDLTATASKIDFLGWTPKPARNWWPHPIFTPNGLREFWPELIASFWRGEFIWQGKRLALPATDAFCWIFSTLAIGLAVIGLFLRRTKFAAFQRRSLWLAFSSFAVLIFLVVILSIAFDFGPCPYPSREHPFFTSGRLLNGAAVPFFLLCCTALDCWLPRPWPRIILFAGIVLFITISQSVLNWPAFSSRYNLFHLGTSDYSGGT